MGAAEQTASVAVAGIEEGTPDPGDVGFHVEQQVAIGAVIVERSVVEDQCCGSGPTEAEGSEQRVVGAEVVGEIDGIETVNSLARGRQIQAESSGVDVSRNVQGEFNVADADWSGEIAGSIDLLIGVRTEATAEREAVAAGVRRANRDDVAGVGTEGCQQCGRAQRDRCEPCSFLSCLLVVG